MEEKDLAVELCSGLKPVIFCENILVQWISCNRIVFSQSSLLCYSEGAEVNSF